jgi:pyruvate dehydrogenase E1 component alpha subunit
MAKKPAKKSALSKTGPKTNKEEMLGYYRDMLLIRRFEEKAGQLYGMGQIAGFCHLYIGQEAVVTGCRAAMIDGDQMITGYRDHAHMLACGMSSRGIMAELTGREGGYSRGKGGSMHMFSTEKHFYGGHGIVGAQVSTARLTKVKSMNRLIWQNYGTFPSFSLLKTTNMRWAPP